MHPRTEATLGQLKNAKWFRCVGIRDTDAAVIVSSWYEAVENCSSPEWQDLCEEAANLYSQKIFERAPKEFNKWNEIVRGLKPAVEALVDEKTRHVIAENDLPKVFVDSVRW